MQLTGGNVSEKETFVPTLCTAPIKRPPRLTAVLVLGGVITDVVVDLRLVAVFKNSSSVLRMDRTIKKNLR